MRQEFEELQALGNPPAALQVYEYKKIIILKYALKYIIFSEHARKFFSK